MNDQISKSQVALWAILGVMFGVGVIALLTAEVWHWKPAEKISEGLGIALLTAALLGVSVDRILKIELARDVFQAAFRYVLPPELKDEVARIIGYKFLCTKHYSVINVVPVCDDLVKVEISVERTIRNISSHTEAHKVLLSLDDWGFPGHPSKVIQCIAEYGDEKYEGKPTKPNRGSSITTETKSISVKSRGEVVAVVKGYEFYRSNGLLVLALRVPTLNPIINVTMPDDLEHECTFGVPDEKVNVSRIANRYELNGTHFPGQLMKLRWWPKNSATSNGDHGFTSAHAPE